MLVLTPNGVGFRHELARLAIESSIGLHRRTKLHLRTIDVLESSEHPDPARLAHHAEAAGDRNRLLRYAVIGGSEAAGRGSHREALRLYGLAARFVDVLSPPEAADLLEAQAAEMVAADLADDAYIVRLRALELRRSWGDKIAEGATLTGLAGDAFASGRGTDSRRLASEAVTLLEQLAPSSELAGAYAISATMSMLGRDRAGAMSWGAKAYRNSRRLWQPCGESARPQRHRLDQDRLTRGHRGDRRPGGERPDRRRHGRRRWSGPGPAQHRLRLRRGPLVSERRAIPGRGARIHICPRSRLAHQLLPGLAGKGQPRAGTLGGGGEAGPQRRHTAGVGSVNRDRRPPDTGPTRRHTRREHRCGASGPRMAARGGDRRPAADLAGRLHQGGARLAPWAGPEQGRVAERIRLGREVRIVLGHRRGRILAVAGRRASTS